MKVLHVITTLGCGGAEKMLVDLVKEMNKQNIECDVAVLTEQNNFWGKKLKGLNIRTYYGESSNVYSIKNVNFLRKLIKVNNYDIIHTHLFAAQLFTTMALTFNRKLPLITTEHSTKNRRRNNYLFKLLDLWMYSKYRKIITISSGSQNSLVSYIGNGSNKTEVIENGIDLNNYFDAELISWGEFIPENNIENYKIVLMVAAMRPAKDYETFIRASKILDKDYKFVIVGDGEKRKFLEEYASKFGGGNVVFLGEKENVPSLMKSSDVFVLSSNWEGFGLVVVEATASGTPVIASDIEGLGEITRKIGGEVFESSNERELALKIEKVINKNREVDISANTDLLLPFSISNTAMQYIDIYKEILNSKDVRE